MFTRDNFRLSKYALASLLLGLAACTDDSDPTSDTGTCDVLEKTCGVASSESDTGCPDGYSCWGPSAFVCYRGDCDLPICLPGSTAIATPVGERPLHDLRRGDLVWSLDHGRKVAVPVLRVASQPAPTHHIAVNITLSDGRQVVASPDHPAADGRALADFQLGEPLDGAEVIDMTFTPYPAPSTWDLLPASSSGAYLANGVWLGSTWGPQ